MILPTQLTVTNAAYAFDGGTTALRAIDEAGEEHTILLAQHAFPKTSRSGDAVPGRLYFDDQLVPQRSEFEAGVLALLRSAEVRYRGQAPAQGERVQLSPNTLILGEDIRQVLTRGPEDNIRAMRESVVQFVESDQYLVFAERVEQAMDETLYDVRVAWDTASRKQVAI